MSQSFRPVQLLIAVIALALLSTTIYSTAYVGSAKVRRAAQEAVCVRNMKEIGIALSLWYHNSDSQSYPLWEMPSMAGKNEMGPWPDMLAYVEPFTAKSIEKNREELESAGMAPEDFARYVDSVDVFRCPSDSPHPHRINEERAKAKGFWREEERDGYEYSYGISVAAVKKHSEDNDGNLVKSWHKDSSRQILATDGVWNHGYNFSAAYVDAPKSRYDAGGWWCNCIGYFHGELNRAVVVCRDNSTKTVDYAEEGKGINTRETFFYGENEGLRVLHQ